MITLQDKFWFGKYKNEIIEDIVYDKPSYVKWCLESIENFDLDSDDTDTVINAYYELSDDLDEYDNSGELWY